MKLNKKIEEIKRVGSLLENKLTTEGLTKKEKTVLNEIRKFISEDMPMSFDPEDIGGARPSRGIQRKIEGGQTPLSRIGLTQAQVDFFTSQAFKDSVKKLELLFGEYSGIDRSLTTANRNLKKDSEIAFSSLYSLVGQLLNELISLQSQYKTELEEIATESVEKVMGIDRSFFSKKLTLDGKFTQGFLRKLEGMRNRIENVSDEEVYKQFSNVDEEKKEKLEQLKKDFEEMGADFDESKAAEAIDSTFVMSDESKQKAKQQFSDEVSRRMIINMFRRGMSIYYDNAYEICKEKILSLPDGERILQLSNVIQPVMVHLYWLFPDIGSVGSSGGGQIGQIQVKPPKQTDSGSEGEEEEKTPEQPQQQKSEQPQQQKPSGPFVIEARAMTFPLIVHELIKGVIMFFTSAGGPEGKKGQLVKKTATSLETEAYDLTYSEKFYEEFYKIFKQIVPDTQEQRDLTPFLLKFISEENYNNLLELTKSLFTLGLSNSDFAKNYITKLVEKSRKLMKAMEQNPSYKEKKQYKSPEQKQDEDGDDNWDSEMSWAEDD